MTPMLRITELPPAEGIAMLKLEGGLTGPWVEELRKAAEAALGRSGRVGLELSDVSYVDAPGIALLKELQIRNVDVRGCSRFIIELLAGE